MAQSCRVCATSFAIRPLVDLASASVELSPPRLLLA